MTQPVKQEFGGTVERTQKNAKTKRNSTHQVKIVRYLVSTKTKENFR